MHTGQDLAVDNFGYQRDEVQVSSDEVLPAITKQTRIGAVEHRPYDILGASNFLLAALVEFYGEYEKQSRDVTVPEYDDGWENHNVGYLSYPNNYSFQSSEPVIDYGWLDIYPGYKNVSVAGDPEGALQAINDRAIDILLVPEGKQVDSDIFKSTRERFLKWESAHRRISACYLYSADGCLDNPDFTIELSTDNIREYIQNTFQSCSEQTDLMRTRADYWEEQLLNSSLVQGFREIEVDEALSYLTKDGE